MNLRFRTYVAIVTCGAVLASGCSPSKPVYLFDDKDMSHYKGMATEIEYPDVETDRIEDVAKARDPLTLSNPEVTEIWDVSLQEAMRTALANSKVLRNLGGLLFTPGLPASNQTIAPTGVLLQTQGQNLNGQSLGTGQTSQTIYNPAMQESNTSNGVEAALSQFDAYMDSQMYWQHNNFPQNQIFTGFQPAVFEQNFAQANAEIGKVTAAGDRVFVRELTNYNANNNQSNQYHQAYTPALEMEFRHPILQGSGTEFNRIAGPNSNNGIFAGQGVNAPSLNPNFLPGTFNGVVLARINVDIALADFEAGVRNMVSDVERAYWDLYYNFRNLNAVQAGRDSALQTWRKVHALYVAGSKGGEAEKEAQAREQYFLFRAQVENTLGLLYTAESRLRYMMGLAPTDGRLIRPSDDPTTAEVHFDWGTVLTEGLTRSVELRRQRWVVKQNELKLIASRNYLMPRLDAQALYHWGGFGNDLVNYNGVAYDPNNPLPNSGAWNTLWNGKYQNWQLGLNFTMPIGFRLAMSGVRNAELVLAQSRAFLQDQELELSHVLTNSIRDLDRNYQVSRTTFNRRVAAAKQVEAVKASYDVGNATLDMLLDAQRRLADAEIAYYRALIDYNVAILQVHYRKNSLLEYNGIFLSEGPWPAKAYFDARKRARERDSAHFINYGFTRPNVLSRGPMPQYMDQPGQPFDQKSSSSTDSATGGPSEGPVSEPGTDDPTNLPPLDGNDEMDTLPAPSDDDTSPLLPSDGGDMTSGDEVPEPPESGGTARMSGPNVGWRHVDNDSGGLRLSPIQRRRVAVESDDVPMTDGSRTTESEESDVPSTVQLVPANGGWRSGGKLR
ncbi:MAG TPA: TolC family protein [Pirellulales bacterium]|nr:TolC family protein [Pirellulales bacterium]